MFNLACCYEKIGKHTAALKQFDTLIVAKSSWTEAYYGASLSAFKLGQYEKAL